MRLLSADTIEPKSRRLGASFFMCRPIANVTGRVVELNLIRTTVFSATYGGDIVDVTIICLSFPQNLRDWYCLVLLGELHNFRDDNFVVFSHSFSFAGSAGRLVFAKIRDVAT